ncbi:jg2781 [Pararge aegeria aegeria]|uniref:Jg2781 protein n=1 Tax=Pararge aegeria aegeria TaxID=348720 RepID=A0A8S4QVI9_9NEOP|nr:jg2781 [Pararge aegeria aegeria]
MMRSKLEHACLFTLVLKVLKLYVAGNTVARRAFYILVVRIRNVDKNVSCVLMECQPHKEATVHSVSLVCGRTGTEEQDCEVPES